MANGKNDLRLHVGWRTHPKVLRLEKLLGPAGPLALVSLWSHAAECRRNGSFFGMDFDDISLASYYQGSGKQLVEALLACKLLDPDMSIHDWKKEQPWIAGKAIRGAIAKQNGQKGGLAKARNARIKSYQSARKSLADPSAPVPPPPPPPPPPSPKGKEPKGVFGGVPDPSETHPSTPSESHLESPPDVTPSTPPEVTFETTPAIEPISPTPDPLDDEPSSAEAQALLDAADAEPEFHRLPGDGPGVKFFTDQAKKVMSERLDKAKPFVLREWNEAAIWAKVNFPDGPTWIRYEEFPESCVGRLEARLSRCAMNEFGGKFRCAIVGAKNTPAWTSERATSSFSPIPSLDLLLRHDVWDNKYALGRQLSVDQDEYERAFNDGEDRRIAARDNISVEEARAKRIKENEDFDRQVETRSAMMNGGGA